MSGSNVAAYVRLSVDDGDKLESNSVKNQKEMLRNYINNNDNMNLYDFYVDDGFSGTNFDRPAFKNLIQDMQERKFDTIIVKDLSRLGRNYIETGKYIEEIFPCNNIRFIAVNDNVDIHKDNDDTINNGIIVPIKNIMNDEYARDISQKTKTVLHTKTANGEFIGSVAPYGYRRDPKDKHNFIVDYKASEVVKLIFKMILDGESKKNVVKKLNDMNIDTPANYFMKEGLYNYPNTSNLNEWTSKKLDRILKNEAYIGHLAQGKTKVLSHRMHKNIIITPENWIVVKKHHEPIINEKDFNKVQEILYERDIRVNSKDEYEKLSGHLFCKECDNSLRLKKSKNHEYYYCTSHLTNKNNCSNHAIRKDKIELIVLNAINQQVNLVIDLNKTLKSFKNDIIVDYNKKFIENSLKVLENEIEKRLILKSSAREDFKNGLLNEEEFNDYQNTYNIEIKELIAEKGKKEKELNNNSSISDKDEWMKYFIKNKKLKKLNKRVVDDLVDKVYIDKKNNVNIVFKYQDEYVAAIDFIKSNFCDIINTECS